MERLLSHKLVEAPNDRAVAAQFRLGQLFGRVFNADLNQVDQ